LLEILLKDIYDINAARSKTSYLDVSSFGVVFEGVLDDVEKKVEIRMNVT
jgi:hypothetical protein